jgi:hypothetical protein
MKNAQESTNAKAKTLKGKNSKTGFIVGPRNQLTHRI